MKVYTKTGDKGETGLVGGARVSKNDARLDVYGGTDELNSHIGMISALLMQGKGYEKDLELLSAIQSALFVLGSNLASESASREKFKLPRLQEALVRQLERAIDEYEKELTPLKNFILPGGVPAAAATQIARAVCRRVERSFVAFVALMPEEEPVLGLEFLNRLSDFLFVLSRVINHRAGHEEPIWKADRA